MSAAGHNTEPPGRLDRLLRFLDRDPTNLNLIADAAAAALDERRPGDAAGLVDRYAALAPLPPALLNLQGLAALDELRFDAAADAFAALIAQGRDDPALRFNLAWSKAMLGQFQAASDALDDTVLAAVPRAAGLKVQALHHLGRLDEALAVGAEAAKARPDDEDLMAALAVAAIDAEQTDLARAYAERAGQTHEGLSTLGMLALAEDDVDQSLALFDRALEADPDSARGRLGRGLGLLAKGDAAAAARDIERSAEVFGDHLGSWVAAGWAHFVQGDYPTSRRMFERTVALDDTFAEGHGGLAVLDVMQGEMTSAERRCEIALRLDRASLSGALAKSLILAAQGDLATAERVRNIALNAPVGPNGRTIAQALVGLGAAPSGRSPRR
jgi:tetratricopeptide (TPR) repeat protein